MKTAILQPTYLPWVGYFEMIASCDTYVAFDHVQFERKSWQNRNKIKTANGVVQLSVPTQKTGQKTKICDVKIANSKALKNHWKTISLAYKKAPYFEKYRPAFEKIYSKNYVLLRDLNLDIIKAICEILNIKTKIILSSKLSLNDEGLGKTEKVVNLCEKLGVTHLYDAKGAEEFLNKDLFEKNNILITFQNFKHPEYKQLWGEFVPYLSAIDLLFNCGKNSIKPNL